MRKSTIKILFILTSLMLVGCFNDSKPVELVSLTGALPKEQAELTKSIMGFDTLQKVKLGPWECFAPNDDLSNQLFCTHNDKLVVHILNTDDLRVMVPTHNKSASYASVIDTDKDGAFDRIEYDGTLENGELNRQVVDENLDGITDRYIDFIKSKLMLNINDTWHEAAGVKNPASGKFEYFVEIDGQQFRVDWQKFPYKLEVVIK
jgi:hypothetical protein